MTRSLVTEKEKGCLLHALSRLVQVITLILLIHFVQAALVIIMGILRLFLLISQPANFI